MSDTPHTKVRILEETERWYARPPAKAAKDVLQLYKMFHEKLKDFAKGLCCFEKRGGYDTDIRKGTPGTFILHEKVQRRIVLVRRKAGSMDVLAAFLRGAPDLEDSKLFSALI